MQAKYETFSLQAKEMAKDSPLGESLKGRVIYYTLWLGM